MGYFLKYRLVCDNHKLSPDLYKGNAGLLTLVS